LGQEWIIILIAGYQKFAGGVGAVATGFEKIPIPLPWLSAVFISTLELVGGALLIVGLGVLARTRVRARARRHDLLGPAAA
jgi:uncharacterized membrane protein YphA (DoxX/SURF4 family)